jgi:hypothetical protein
MGEWRNGGVEEWRKWRKRLGVEPSQPATRAATGFEDRGGHRAPFASVAELTMFLRERIEERKESIGVAEIVQHDRRA